MTIEIKEKGTRRFYKEVVNIAVQYNQLLYKPTDNLKDNFITYSFLAIAMAAFFILNLYSAMADSFSTSRVMMMAIAGTASLTTVIYLMRLNKMVNSYMAEERPSLLTLDENGVGLEKTGAQTVRLEWDNVAFVRSFAESTCFFSKDMNGIILSVTNEHKKEIIDYIKSNNIDVMVI